jgi:PII-like signaling protein
MEAERANPIPPARKLTAYFNEALRSGGRLAADRLLDTFGREDVKASVLLRGIEGFGAHHRLHTERFENASLDQPVVAVAVDGAERIERIVEEVDRLLPSGLVTTERAWLLSDDLAADALPEVAHGSVKLTVYCGRAERHQGKPAFQALIDHLQVCGVDGATAFLGVDGTVHGQRQRARFVSRNRDVPLMVISVGDGEAVLRALPGIAGIATAPVVTVEGIQLCKRDGVPLAPPEFDGRADGNPFWRKLMIHAAGDTHVGGESLHYQLVEQLRELGAAGATSLRGIWGYRGQAPAHGDSAWSVRRTSPVVTIVIDRDERLAESWEAIDLLTRRHGLVTSELVPAHRALTAAQNGNAG